MTRSLQGREDFTPGFELVPVIQIELVSVRSAGMVKLNTESEQRSRGGIRKPCAGNYIPGRALQQSVGHVRAEGLGCSQREQERTEMVSVPPRQPGISTRPPAYSSSGASCCQGC